MSGIVGMINRDGAPADRDLLLRMARRMADRAPDGLGVWSSGHVGLGLATLRIAGEPVEPEEPHSLDGIVWIVADARIDSRDELIASLRAAGQNVEAAASSAALILHAYRAFGEIVCRTFGWRLRLRFVGCGRAEAHLRAGPFWRASILLRKQGQFIAVR